MEFPAVLRVRADSLPLAMIESGDKADQGQQDPFSAASPVEKVSSDLATNQAMVGVEHTRMYRTLVVRKGSFRNRGPFAETLAKT